MTSPVDTLKAMRENEYDRSGAECDALDAAIAALSGGEAPVAWMHSDDLSRVVSAKQKACALRDGGASASSLAPYTIPLYTTPRAAGDGMADSLRAVYAKIPQLPVTPETCGQATDALTAFCMMLGVHGIDTDAAPSEGSALNPSGKVSEYEVPDDDLPGMWERSDFIDNREVASTGQVPDGWYWIHGDAWNGIAISAPIGEDKYAVGYRDALDAVSRSLCAHPRPATPPSPAKGE